MGLRMRNIENVMEEPDARPALIFDDVKNLDMDGFAASPPACRRYGSRTSGKPSCAAAVLLVEVTDVGETGNNAGVLSRH